jgi:hypothetical protein
MAKQNSTPKYVTREILKEEISASEKRLASKIAEENSGVEKRLTAKIAEESSGVEKRLDARIEIATQSFKDYIDSRLMKTDATIKDLDTKMTKYFELMMQTFTDGNKGINRILSNHEERITVLEGRGPQPGRI